MFRLAALCALVLVVGCEVAGDDADGGAGDGGVAADAAGGGGPSADDGGGVLTDAGPAADGSPVDDLGVADDMGAAADTGGPTADMGAAADMGSPQPYTGDHRGLPPVAEVTTEDLERKVLPGRTSTDPTDMHMGAPGGEVDAADTVGGLLIAMLLDDQFGEYYFDPRYSHFDWPVTRVAVSGLGGPAVTGYRIEPPQTRATDFVARPHGLFHRFDAAVDWEVFTLNDGVLDLVAEVPAASVRVDGYTRVGDITVESIEQARTFVFARADRTLSPFVRVGEDGVRGGRLADTGAGRVVQLRYPLPGAPFDTVDDYGFGPSTWENQYGAHRAFHAVRRDGGPGVVWQDVETNQVRVTWLSDADPAAATHVALPTLEGARLAAAQADADGSVTCLHIQRGDGRPNATRAVTLVKANAQGAEVRRAALDAGPDAMNIVEFGDRDHATMTRSGDRLGIVVTRTMHRAPDGLNHQGGLALTVNADTLAVTGPIHWPGHPETPVGPIQTSSHAFANVLLPDGDGGFLGADLGDAAPRGVNLYRLSDAELVTRVAFTFKTRHGTTPSAYPGGPTYPVYAEISSPGQTFYQWSNDNTTYTELGGVAKTDDGVVVLFSTERSLLDNSRLGALWNETRDLAMVRVRSDFPRAAAGRDAVVTDDLVLSQGAPAVESKYYFFTGDDLPQRVAGVVFLTQLAADQSASRPHLHARADGLLAVYEVWRTTRTPGANGQPDTFADAYLDTRAVRLTTEGLPVMGSDSSLGSAVRLQNRDDLFTLAGGTALVAGDGEGRALVVTVVLPAAP